VEPAWTPSTRIWLPFTATVGASITSSTFSALGRWTFLSMVISPDAENDDRRKMTVTTRKSMKLTRFRAALGLRAPWPCTLFHTYFSLMLWSSLRPGWWMTCACGFL
jgi:hypothetical protein